jgi:HEAT repeat protein
MPKLTRCSRSIGFVLLAWFAFLVFENFAVAVLHRRYIAGAWELSLTRNHVTPIAFAGLAVLAPSAVVLRALVLRADASRASRAIVVAVAIAFGAAVGIGVTFGRHFTNLLVRVPFVLTIAGACAAIAWNLAPKVARTAAHAPRKIALLAVSVAFVAWLADAFVLARLYPAFHHALFGLSLLAVAFVPLAFERGARRAALGRYAPYAAMACAAIAIARIGVASRRLHPADNLRLVLVERAPLLGRAVALAAAVAPPPPLDEDVNAVVNAAGKGAGAGFEAPRTLDWTGRDIVLISVDALRADHIGAYGYPRATTPHLDALAREGAVFEYAYCPTPHTSYSITSMMTGKYMRPLVALGLGDDSDTWARHLRRYGYRTAAFYPPAVFFIDGERFQRFRDDALDFEYRKIEFGDADLRLAQVDAYLEHVGSAKPLFLWVHLFEPHEPYVVDRRHVFGDPASPTSKDAYDSEVAAADAGIGAIVARVRRVRPSAIVIVTADHGEEFGEHGGRYHGTTVYEEQVRVPLIVVGPGVVPRRIVTVVQTIDLMPTVLSAIGVPRPARVRGRDLGPMLVGASHEHDTLGLAFAETEEYTLVARGRFRLVCRRKLAACALYDVVADPKQERDVSKAHRDTFDELRRLEASIAKEHGRFERGTGEDWPAALRRGMQGDADAAEEVATLLDDADVAIRRKAAEVLFVLHVEATAPQLRRALSREEDETARRFVALALTRIGEPPPPLAEKLVTDADAAFRLRAALAFAERRDGRGEAEIVSALASVAASPQTSAFDFDAIRELVNAAATIRANGATAPLVRLLDDVRLRPLAAEALGVIRDPSAKGPLLAAFAGERYVSARPVEARALVRLGARRELFAPLARFAGVPEPMAEAIAIAREADLLEPSRGGYRAPPGARDEETVLTVPDGNTPLRLLVELHGAADATPPGTPGGAPLVFVDGVAVPALDVAPGVFVAELAPESHGVLEVPPMRSVRVRIALAGAPTRAPSAALDASPSAASPHLAAVWLVRRAEEIPPPPPEPWAPPDGSDVPKRAPPSLGAPGR